MKIGASLLIPLLEGAAAYLTLDLVFRRIPLDPQRLRRTLRRWGRGYAAAALVMAAAGAAAQWYLAGIAGACLAPLNLLPWWALWRHGVRKQFPILWTLGPDEAP
ncbi:MAG TPA: hypothetical protein VIL07_00070 [Symbiobacteriaceae bacterium]